MISILASDTVRPNAAHTTTITPIIFMSCAVKFQATLASSSYNMPHSKVKRAGSPSVAPPRPPSPYYPSEVQQSVREVFVRLETRVGHVYKRRKEDVEEEGCEHTPLANALCSTANQPPLILSVSHISTVLHTNSGCGKRETKTRPMEKPEKAAPVPGTALRTTGSVPMDSRQ